MAFIETTGQIARGFLAARAQPLGGHPLADVIRTRWPADAAALLGGSMDPSVKVKGSPGLGRWNEAPWLAFLDERVTRSAREGYYPLYLFEDSFQSICLVLAQGTDLLRESIGRVAARKTVIARAEALRVKARRWKEAGFETGPFRTYSRIEGGFGADEDGWASSVAFGRRYRLDPPPQIASLRTDLAAMLEIYRELASTLGASFTEQDEALSALASSDGIPPGGLDGAMQVVEHKRLERRKRNTRLVAQAKQRGSRCEGCALDLHRVYPDHWEGLIEAHHKRPLSQAPREGEQLSVDDFALLCPTCHRLIHRMGCPDLPRFVAMLPLEVRQWHLKENF